VLGLRAAEEWNLYAPDSVKELLAQWYDYSQADDGSFGYTMPYVWNNISKTGAGILGLFYCGQNPSSESVVDAFNYIDTHWATDGEFWDNYPDGHYIMYGFYSAFKACMSWCPLIERIGDHDWYTEMAQNLVAYQNQSGSARGSWSAHMWESDNLATSWALQILAKALHVRYPVADAGGPYDSDTTTAVNLSGCGSYHNDPYRDIVLFEWDFEDDGVYDYSSVTCTATHTYPIEGTYTVRLRVADDSYPCILADTDTAQVTISTAAHNPVAVCGGPYLGWIGVSVTFDGSGSYDIDVGDSIVGWEWDIDNDGQFDDASGSIVTNTWNSTYEGVVGLRVTDTTARIGACWTTVTIGNHAPVAESGGPYVGCQNRMLILEGNDSYDPDEPAGDSIVSWMWDLDGDRLFDDALGEIAEISVDVFWPTPGVRDIGLRVTDSYGRFHDDWTSVDVQEEAECNEPPVANAGPDQETCMGDTVQLDGSGSHDADGDPLTCFWSILSAPACSSAILSDPAAMRPTLEPDCEGDFACQLIVNDYMSDSEPDTVMVSVSECGAYVCPVSHGYWKNHLEDWPVSSLVLGDETYTQAELAAILAKARNNDASSILGMQFVAAKLNIANGSDPAPISDTIELADELLSAYSGKLPYRVPPSAADGRAMVEYAEELDRYNNGSATPDCELW
jgi:PKD repeat protein